MSATTLIVPGLYGSGELHWQTWIEQQIEGARRVEQRDWNSARLDEWSDALLAAINESAKPVWIIAHSFGCLVTAAAAQRCTNRIRGAMLVAPANPERFSVHGLEPRTTVGSISSKLPHTALGFPAVVVASTNDPWMRFTTANVWAERWGARLVNLGAAGHINAEAGFGPWQQGLDLFNGLREAHHLYPLGEFDERSAPHTTRERYALRAMERHWFA
ncbi:MAG: alpha/beta hydrolase [Burkholderiales bacterium]|nr:MAG: alpha/beta hydrolase [Burkholderiales bacterium]TAG83192.1 MAG: alpha/beta hydrolase [Betaproteobacteria bacterium]